MDDVLWLFVSTPKWFIQNSVNFEGPLDALPTLGMAALAVGLVLTVIRREWRLSAFLVPLFASQVLLVIAGVTRGRVAQDSADIILYSFLALQAILAAILIWRFRDSRLAASALAVFSVCYALFASFVATNAMANSWL
jgi:hypothetical protein